MLLLEGCDGVGKTTLAKRLVKELDGHIYAHFTRLPRDFDRYWGYRERMSTHVVQDRFHLSEIVYAYARGDESPLCPDTYRLVDAAVRQLAGFTVLITADDALIGKRWHGDQMFSLDLTLATNERYSKLGAFFTDYEIDIDYRFHCTEQEPYVTDRAVAEILERYRRRLRTVNAIASGKPFAL